MRESFFMQGDHAQISIYSHVKPVLTYRWKKIEDPSYENCGTIHDNNAFPILRNWNKSIKSLTMETIFPYNFYTMDFQNFFSVPCTYLKKTSVYDRNNYLHVARIVKWLQYIKEKLTQLYMAKKKKQRLHQRWNINRPLYNVNIFHGIFFDIPSDDASGTKENCRFVWE